MWNEPFLNLASKTAAIYVTYFGYLAKKLAK